MRRHVAVLSARGFFGSTLAASLRGRSEINLLELDSERCNLLDPMRTARAIQALPEPLTVLFLSAFGRPPDDFHVYSRNVAMATNLLTALLSKRVENFIFTSSVCTYGRPPERVPVTEDIPVSPNSHYGLSKFVSEKLFRFNLNCPVTILRAAGTYGARDRGNSVVSALMNQLLAGKPIRLDDGGTSRRDFLAVDDIVAVISHFIAAPFDGVLNVASGESVSIRDLVEIIATELRVEPMIDLVTTGARQFDLTFDLSRLASVLPTHRPTTIRDGVRALAAVRLKG